jgi:signal transduction histidine kinase
MRAQGDRAAPDFRALFEATTARHLALTTRDLTIVAVSDAFLRDTMAVREEILGRGFFEVFPEVFPEVLPEILIEGPDRQPSETARKIRASIERVLQTRVSDALAVRRYCMRRHPAAGAGFDERSIAVVNSPVIDDEGRVAFIIHTIEDVMEPRRPPDAPAGDDARTVAWLRAFLQQELSSERTEIDVLTRELAQKKRASDSALSSAAAARDEALRRSQLKTRFLGMVSHELRTPLTALCLQVERMQRNARDLDARHRESLERISFSASRLREMIETLLEYARVDGGHVAVNTASFDLADSVHRMVENHRDEAEQRGLELNCSTLAPLAVVQSDQRLVELVVSNLVDNAIKFTNAGRIDVVLGKSADGAHRVAVSDSGPGIPEPQQKRIFEPFEQLGSSRRSPSGIGLGLALVRDIAGALGGRIELVSRLREGSTFTFVLPSVAAKPPSPQLDPGQGEHAVDLDRR